MPSIVSFDIGYVHLAMVNAKVTWDGRVECVDHCMLYDLRKIKCNSSCKHFDPKDKSTSHRLIHFVKNHHFILLRADVILLELQPLQGLKAVEQCLYMLLKMRFGSRVKVRLVAPVSVHSLFKMSSDYDLRKVESTAKTEKYLATMAAFRRFKRKHDMADAMLFILYYTQSGLFKRDFEQKTNNPFISFEYCSPNT